MPTVPLIQKTVQQEGLPGARLSSSIKGIDTGAGLSSAAESLNKFVAVETEKANTVALLDAQRKFDDWETTNIYDAKNGALAKKGKDAFDLPNQLGQQFDKDMAGIRDGLGNSDQQIAFDKMLASRRDTIMRTLHNHERVQMDEHSKQVADAAFTSSVNRSALNYNNPSVAEAAINNAKAARVAWGRSQGMADEAIDNMVLEAESKSRMAILSRYADEDPKGALDYYKAHQGKLTGEDILKANSLMAQTELRYKAKDVATRALAGTAPKVEADAVNSFVMNNLEGGDRVVIDNNGYVSKFGINKKAYPDVDVENLTEEGAKKLYKERWDRLGIEKLSPDLRLPAMAFGTTNEKELPRLVKESGGDVGKFQQLAWEFYQDIARKNPKQNAGSLKGWMNRLEQVSTQVSYIQGQKPDEYALGKQIDKMSDDDRVTTAAKELVSKQITAMDKAIREREAYVGAQIDKYEAAGAEAPVSLIAQLSPEKQKAYYAKAYDPLEYERLRKQVAQGQPIDLESYRFKIPSTQLRGLFDMQAKPELQALARAVDKNIYDNVSSIIGQDKSEAKTAEDFKQIESFRNRIYDGIKAFEFVSNKKATDDDVDTIAARLIREDNAHSSWRNWFGKERGVSIEGIPQVGSYRLVKKDENGIVDSQYIDYDHLVSSLTVLARSTNSPVTPEGLARLYAELKRNGMIFEMSKSR